MTNDSTEPEAQPDINQLTSQSINQGGSEKFPYSAESF